MKILIITEIELSRQFLPTCFGSRDHKVALVDQDSITTWPKNNRCDAVIFDLDMIEDRYTLLEEIREKFDGIPIIVLSSHGYDGETIERCQQIGGIRTRYVSKSIGPKKMYPAIMRMIEESKRACIVLSAA